MQIMKFKYTVIISSDHLDLGGVLLCQHVIFHRISVSLASIHRP